MNTVKDNNNNDNALLENWQVNDDDGLLQGWQVNNDVSDNNEDKVCLFLRRSG